MTGVQTCALPISSAVLLELIHRDIAPTAIVMREPDAILLLGVIVAREMGWAGCGAFRMLEQEMLRTAT